MNMCTREPSDKVTELLRARIHRMKFDAGEMRSPAQIYEINKAERELAALEKES